VRELRPLVTDRLDAQAARVHDVLVLGGRDRADGVRDRSVRLHPLGRYAQQLELELGQRLRPPTEVRARCQDAEPRARRVDEHAVEAGQLCRELAGVGVHHRDVGEAQPADAPLELTRAALVQLDRDHLRASLGELRRLPAGSGAQVEHPLPRTRADRCSRQL
jgi:hypothetical protein